MSGAPQKPHQPRVEPSAEPGWPQWMADALAYKPENQTPEAGKMVSAESNERRNIRTLSRVSNS